MFNTVQIALLCAGFAILWFFFFRTTSAFALFTFEYSSLLVALIFTLVRVLFIGYITYLVIAVFGNINRIVTVDALFSVLTARPSQLGGPGLIGVVVGVLFGIRAFWGAPSYSGYGSSRSVSVQVVKKAPMVATLLVAVYRRIKR